VELTQRPAVLSLVCRLSVFAILLAVLSASVASAQRAPSTGRRPSVDLSAEVVRTTREYRATLERALPALEADARDAADTVYERRDLEKAGILSAEYVTDAERAWAAAEKSLSETRAAIEEADRIILEASVHEQLVRRAPLPRGGFEDIAALVRFNGTARWSLQDVPQLDQLFAANFGRRLPISSMGQTKVHDRLGLDHRGAIDVAVHPDSAEGQWLMQHLRRAGVPFIGVRAELRGASTGAHIHVGPPSSRLLGPS
jgi:hypothetical protein